MTLLLGSARVPGYKRLLPHTCMVMGVLLASLPAVAQVAPSQAPAATRVPVEQKRTNVVLRGLLVSVGEAAALAAPAYQPHEVCRGLPPASSRLTRPALTPDALQAQRAQLVQASAVAGASAASRIQSNAPHELVALERLQQRLARHIDQPITDALNRAILDDVIQVLNEQSRYLVDVYFPEQTIDDGVVMVVVRPALLGQVVAQGQQHHRAQDITCRIRLEAGQPVDLQLLAEDIAGLNSTSSWRRTQSPEFRPGTAPGTTDVVLTTQDEKPLRYFVGADNTGTRATGEGRYRAGVNVGNFLGRFDHQLDYTFTTASRPRTLNQHSLAYQMPLEERQRLSARLDYTQSDVTFEEGLFRAEGNNLIMSVELARPVASRVGASSDSVTSELYYGLDYKRVGAALAFNQTPISDVKPRVLQAQIGWRGRWQDRLGATGAYASLVVSPGGLVGNNDDATFNASREGAVADYWIVKGGIAKQIDLPQRWSMAVNVNGQWTRQALISSERMGLGGYGGVRGYYQDTLTADAGLVASIELQTPRQPFVMGNYVGQWYALAFVEGARSWNASAEFNADLDKTSRTFSLASHGIGIRADTSNQSHFRLDLGRRHFGLNNDKRWFWHGSWQWAF